MTLILFYNTLWGEALEPRESLPADFEITTDRTRYAAAQVVVFHIPQWKWQPLFLFPKKLLGQLWVAWSMECEANYPRLTDPSFISAFDLTMTYRLDSGVPVPYIPYYDTADNLRRSMRNMPQPKTAKAPAVSFISSRINRSGRREYVESLMEHLHVDSYGKFRRNATLVPDHGRPSKLETIARYRFTLGFENACAPDYVTEKFYDPLVVGSVPVYLGAPNVEQFAPGDHCYINVADFPKPQDLAAYLIALTQDEAAYNAYLEWRTKPFNPAFEEFLERFGQDSVQRLCIAVRTRLAAGTTSGK